VIVTLERGPAGRWQPSRDPVDVRFWGLVRGPWLDPTITAADCWPWLGGTAGSRAPKSWGTTARPWKRYGRFRFNGRLQNAARVALILFSGPPADPDAIASHFKCDASLCTNPYHLRWDSQAANVAEAIAKGRLARDPRGLYQSTGARGYLGAQKMPIAHVCNPFCGGGAGGGQAAGRLHAVLLDTEQSDMPVLGKVAAGLAANEGLAYKGFSLVPMPDELAVGMVTRFGIIRARLVVWGEVPAK
jgi:hypothetical protein